MMTRMQDCVVQPRADVSSPVAVGCWGCGCLDGDDGAVRRADISSAGPEAGRDDGSGRQVLTPPTLFRSPPAREPHSSAAPPGR